MVQNVILTHTLYSTKYSTAGLPSKSTAKYRNTRSGLSSSSYTCITSEQTFNPALYVTTCYDAMLCYIQNNILAGLHVLFLCGKHVL